ncbi:MAG: hypothetical protein QXU40_04150 [Candidatus Pacearchaeota archaeon]
MRHIRLGTFGYLLNEASNIETSLIVNIEKSFMSFFPKSWIEVIFDNKFNINSLLISFTLGKDVSEYLHRIKNNDPMYTVIQSYDLDLNPDGSFARPVKFNTIVGGNLKVESKNPKYYEFNEIKVWRPFVAKDSEQLLDYLENFFLKLKSVVKKNINKIYGVPFDPRTKL